MKLFAFILIALEFSAAHADTYFETMKKTFCSAHEDISLSDFDGVDCMKAKTCVAVASGSPDQEFDVFLRKFAIKKPGDGPLLPPKTVYRILFSQAAPPDGQGTDITVTTTFDRKSVHTTGSVTNYGYFDVTARKYESYVVFSLTAPGAKDPYAFGYCY